MYVRVHGTILMVQVERVQGGEAELLPYVTTPKRTLVPGIISVTPCTEPVVPDSTVDQ